MLRTITIAAIFALVAGVADAQKIDKNGRCHDAKGHFAKMEVCKGSGAPATAASKRATAPAATAPAKPVTGAAAGYKLDAKGNCHDAKGKMVKKAQCKA